MIEVKPVTGSLSGAHEHFEREREAGGGEYLVARSVDDVAHLVACLPLGQSCQHGQQRVPENV